MLSVITRELFLSVYLKSMALLGSGPKLGRAMRGRSDGEQRDECAVG